MQPKQALGSHVSVSKCTACQQAVECTSEHSKCNVAVHMCRLTECDPWCARHRPWHTPGDLTIPFGCATVGCAPEADQHKASRDRSACTNTIRESTLRVVGVEKRGSSASARLDSGTGLQAASDAAEREELIKLALSCGGSDPGSLGAVAGRSLPGFPAPHRATLSVFYHSKERSFHLRFDCTDCILSLRSRSPCRSL